MKAAIRTAMAFDFGTNRIGVAVGDGLLRHAQPLCIIASIPLKSRWEKIAELIGSWEPSELVVGKPLYPDGKPHEMTALAEKFARQLQGRFALPVYLVDERYSSAVIEHAPGEEIDHMSASLILEQWFAETAKSDREA